MVVHHLCSRPSQESRNLIRLIHEVCHHPIILHSRELVAGATSHRKFHEKLIRLHVIIRWDHLRPVVAFREGTNLMRTKLPAQQYLSSQRLLLLILNLTKRKLWQHFEPDNETVTDFTKLIDYLSSVRLFYALSLVCKYV